MSKRTGVRIVVLSEPEHHLLVHLLGWLGRRGFTGEPTR